MLAVYFPYEDILSHDHRQEGQIVSDEELKATLEGLKKLREEHAGSPEKARAFLVEAGFITPDGKLTENYRQDA
jgi:hypothetical protein